jgi:hypothetical protein
MNKNNFDAILGGLSLTSLLFSGISYHGLTPIHIILIIYFINISNNLNDFRFKNSGIALISFISIYSIFGYLNLHDRVFIEDRAFQYGSYRPILAGIQLMVTLFFCKSLIFKITTNDYFCKKFQSFYILTSSSILTLMILSYFAFGNFSHIENGSFQALTRESGVAGLTIFPLLIVSIATKRHFVTILSSVAIFLTGSTAALAVCIYIFLSLTLKRKFLIVLLVFIVISFFIFTYSPEHHSKIELLLNPKEGDTGGRYSSNFAHIFGIINYPFFGTGIETLDLHRSELFNSISLSFDHGGSDFLRIVQDFGVVGSALLIFILKKYFNINNINIYCIIPFIILIVIKGVGVYSISALVPIIFTLYFLKIYSNKI